MQTGRIYLAVALLGLAGCADTATLVPQNAQAQAVGSPRLVFFRGFGGAPSKIIMPDGETLPGEVVVRETAASIAPGGQGNLTITGRGPRTSLDCHGNMIAGHGTAECRDQNGATYKIDL